VRSFTDALRTASVLWCTFKRYFLIKVKFESSIKFDVSGNASPAYGCPVNVSSNRLHPHLPRMMALVSHRPLEERAIAQTARILQEGH
jgi:hypothetical protein